MLAVDPFATMSSLKRQLVILKEIVLHIKEVTKVSTQIGIEDLVSYIYLRMSVPAFVEMNKLNEATSVKQ